MKKKICYDNMNIIHGVKKSSSENTQRIDHLFDQILLIKIFEWVIIYVKNY